jgi:hypothetical protein
MSTEVLVWWRDDDAGRHDARLDRLLELAGAGGWPLGLAVVPAWLDAATARRILAAPTVHALQHGWAHENHAASGARSIELGGTIDLATCRTALGEGAARLRSAFAGRFLPVMVPPWNRIDPPCLEMLAPLGFRGLSSFADDARGTALGLVQVNTHVDLVDWRGGRRMKPLAKLRGEVDALLAQPGRRVIGFLSHHLEMGLDDMARMRQLLAYVDGLERCRWAALPSLFAER